MALVTVQRSPSINDSPTSIDGSPGTQDDNMDTNRSSKSLSECYFAGKGTALVLPDADAQKSTRRQDDNNCNGNGTNGSSSNIQKHLQSMFYLLRPEETLKMAVKLESVHPSRTRYLVVVSRMGIRAEESCLLGIDCNEKTTVGLVLKVMADTTIRLDGDGGFSVSVCGRYHIFKPVSVQAMWSALQTLHKISAKARDENYYHPTGITHSWVNYYEERIESERSCLNEWHAMDNLESKRPPSPDSIRTKPTEREETERVIRTTLKEIMMSVDLDEVTSKYIRTRLEEDLDMDLGEYKSFIDQEMLTILGQMDAPTEIFDHVYLGSEWNASNYEELQRNGVGHILNVTREIDNFFPGTFDYLNVRVYDDEKTDLLKHWDDTFKYITKAKMNGSKVLVHCKMGVSRSASVVIAYAMKAYNWDFQKAMSHVKEKRNCIKPNTNFLSQLETYQGMLAAMKNKEKLQRSKSDTNLKEDDDNNNNNNSNNSNHNNNNTTSSDIKNNKNKKILVGSEPTPVIQALNKNHLQTTLSGQDLRNLNNSRPKSWSPDYQQQLNQIDNNQLKNDDKSIFLSLEDLSQKSTKESPHNQARNVLMPCDNGENYSVSPNQIVHLHAQTVIKQTVKERINELESKEKSPIWDPGDILDNNLLINNICDDDGVILESRTVWTSSTIIKNVPETSTITTTNSIVNSKVPESLTTTTTTASTTTTKARSDPFSNQLDRVFDREEKKQSRNSTIIEQPQQSDNNRECPSRQNSWSSYDSAVVLCSNNDISSNNGLSRHSSWGSADTRVLPSRNSSWGSYDIRHCNSSNNNNMFQYDKEEIPWYPGTVKRTKQKLEECNGVTTKSTEDLYDEQQQPKRTSAITIDLNPVITTARLSVSAPETSTMDLITKDCQLSRSTTNVSTLDNNTQPQQCSSVKQHRTFLENLRNHKDRIKLTIDSNINKRTSGIVRSLKKEFEAKTNLEPPPSQQQLQQQNEDIKQSKNKSMPSSPISLHQSKENNLKQTQATSDDLINFKNLVGLFESNKTTDDVCRRSTVKSSYKNLRHSCIEPVERDSTNFKKINLEFNKRPPISPNIVKNTVTTTTTAATTEVATTSATTTTTTTTTTPSFVAATIIAKAVKKQQQFGKSHPLARLNIKPRHNNPVYNTM